MKNITNRLVRSDRIDELEVFLGTRGASTRSEIQGLRVLYEDGRLVVEYNKHHRIRSISVADDYGEKRVARLECEVADALSEGDMEVRQQYLHSRQITTGYYRYGSQFQLLPSPPDSPQPGFAYAYHSFLLEFGYPKSPHELVDQHRADRRFSELSLVLNALVRDLQLPSASTTHEWAIIPGSPSTSGFLQLGYRGGRTAPPEGCRRVLSDR